MKLYHFFTAIVFIIIFSSCEEVITLDLDESAQRAVIEANLNAVDGTCSVSLTKSNGFYSTNGFDKIENATVWLVADSGLEYALSETETGIYFTENIAVSPGQEFTIIIDAENTLYQAAAKVPFPVVLDSLESFESFGFGDSDSTIYNIALNWKDLENEANFYRVKVTQNGEYQTGIYFLYDDENQDGDDIRIPLIGQEFAKNDIAQIELMSINKATYRYFSDLSIIQSSGLNATTPFNPKSNFDNDALGYFGIWYADMKEIEVE